jgi:hypothetical protein
MRQQAGSYGHRLTVAYHVAYTLAEVTRFCPGTLGKASYDLPSMARGRSSPRG